LDVANQVKRWRDYKRDKPLMKNSNARLQLRNWMENAVKFAARNGNFRPAPPKIAPLNALDYHGD
jgi:hypothetical protein